MGNTFGYISGYTLKPDGAFNGTINTLDFDGKNTNIPLNLNVVFENVWGIKSPNKNDQFLVMTEDSAYISVFSYIFTSTRQIFTAYLGESANTNVTPIYIGLYFILVYGFYGNSEKTSKQFISILQLLEPSTVLVTNNKATVSARPNINLVPLSPTSSPSYASEISTFNQLGSSQLLDKLIKDSYLNYIVCSDLATNDSKSPYYAVLDPASLIIVNNNIKSSDWTYAANYFYTIYSFAADQHSNFCVTNTTPIPDDATATNTPTDCRVNKSASSLINTPSGPYGQGGAAAWAVNNKMTIIYIVIGILLCFCCLSSLVFIMVSSAKSGRRRNSGGYFYLD